MCALLHLMVSLSFRFFRADQKPVLSGEEQERKITTYEGAMMKIKDATGVSDIRVSVALNFFYVQVNVE